MRRRTSPRGSSDNDNDRGGRAARRSARTDNAVVTARAARATLRSTRKTRDRTEEGSPDSKSDATGGEEQVMEETDAPTDENDNHDPAPAETETNVEVVLPEPPSNDDADETVEDSGVTNVEEKEEQSVSASVASKPIPPDAESVNQQEQKQKTRSTRASAATTKTAPSAPSSNITQQEPINTASTTNNDPLDESALDDILQFLTSSSLCHDILDEEDILQLIHRTSKSAMQLTRNYRSLVDSSGSDDAALFDECLAQAEDQTLSDDLIQDIVQHVEQQGVGIRLRNMAQQPSILGSPVGRRAGTATTSTFAAAASNTATTTTSIDQQPKKSLDRRTVSWVKRTIGAGLRKRSVPSRFKQHLLAHPAGIMSGTQRRYTRGMAKSTSSKRKKKEKDMDLLYAAVKSLAKERGRPFSLPPLTRRPSSLPLDHQAHDDDEEAAHAAVREQKKQALDNGNNDKENSKRGSSRDARKAKRKRDKEDRSRRKKQKLRRKEPPPENTSPDINLVDLENQRRLIVERPKSTTTLPPTGSTTAPTTTTGTTTGTTKNDNGSNNKKTVIRARIKESYEKRAKVVLPMEYRTQGIMHRLPRWHKFSKAVAPPSAIKSLPLASTFPGLINGNQTWLFAITDNFCSDIDRPWYEKTQKETRIANGGARSNKGIFIARLKWKTMRRRRQHRPRLFSMKFIHDELKDRNEYRLAVRFLQQKPEMASQIGFPHPVPAQFRAGTLISAINWKRHIVQRGIVLNYDTKNSSCLVKFEGGDLALCPDSEVVTRPAHSDQAVSERGGSAANLLLETNTRHRLPLWNKIEKLAQFEPLLVEDNGLAREGDKAPSTGKRTPLIERVAEREALVILMGAINANLVRKDLLLNALEKLDDLVTSRVPPQTLQETSVSEQLKSHRSWLEDCIRQTDIVLEKRLGYLSAFYGKAYLPPQHAAHTSRELSRAHIGEVFNRVSNISCSAATAISTGRLMGNMEEFGESMAATALNRSQRATIEPCLRSAIELLLASSFAANIAHPQLALAMSEELRHTAFREQQSIDVDAASLLAQVQLSKGEAMNELRVAMTMLHVELSLSNLSSVAAARFGNESSPTSVL